MDAAEALEKDLREKVHPWVQLHSMGGTHGAIRLGVYNVPQDCPAAKIDAVLCAHRDAQRQHWHGREPEFTIHRVRTPRPPDEVALAARARPLAINLPAPVVGVPTPRPGSSLGSGDERTVSPPAPAKRPRVRIVE